VNQVLKCLVERVVNGPTKTPNELHQLELVLGLLNAAKHRALVPSTFHCSNEPTMIASREQCHCTSLAKVGLAGHEIEREICGNVIRHVDSIGCCSHLVP
jgi:hypothetical protein